VKNLICAALALAVVACAPTSNTNTASDTAATASTTASTTTNTTAAPTTGEAPATATVPKAGEEEKPMSNYENKVAELHTTSGEIDIRFFPDKAPNHVKNFIDLAEKGFYNGSKFHRVIPGFMIQGGDPNTKTPNTSSWGMGGSGKNVKAEFNNVSHKRGIVSMARSNDPNSASSQFFIVVKDSTFLDKQYTVFGQVTKGMDVADKIVSAPRNAQDRPDSPVSITSIKIRPATDAEKGPAPQ